MKERTTVKLTVTQATEKLRAKGVKVSDRQVRNWCRDKILDAERIGFLWIIDEESLDNPINLGYGIRGPND